MRTRKKPGKMQPAAEKTAEKSVEQEILEALGEFTEALEQGNLGAHINCRQIKLDLQETAYDSALVKKTRKILGASQPLFAQFLGVSPKTVKAWEQGLNVPHAMACRFMDEIRLNPKFWIGRFQKIAVTKHATQAQAL